MAAGHRIEHVAIGMRTERFPHSFACAKSQITCGVKSTKASAQSWPCPAVTVVSLHHWKPIEKQTDQRQSIPLSSFLSEVTQSAFCQRKDHIRFELFNRCLQCGVSRQRPD